MHLRYNIFLNNGSGVALTVLAALSLGGCYGGDSPSVKANPQTISFAAAPAPNLDVSSATVSATASSGRPVSYGTLTPSICSVDSSTGLVTGMASGTCTIAANQSGDIYFAPAAQATQTITFRFSQTLAFGPAPSLSLYDRATVSASASSGLPVSYGSLTPTVCSVDSNSGLVTALLTGDCTVAATAGVLQATQTITVSTPTGITHPGAPTGVTATAGNSPSTVTVRIGETTSGGSPITGYTITSVPALFTTSGAASPVTVTCPTSCAGYAFSVTATTAVGNSAPSAAADVITGYNVIETFYEPDTQPNNSILKGSFTFNSTTATVSNLHGMLSESMTGGANGYPNDTMSWLTLNNQLSSVYDPALGGLLVTVFKLTTTNTLSANPLYGGTDGWFPGTGSGLYYSFPAPTNPGNAYARIFVNTANPTAPLTQAQINMLAYADCAPGGMMGAVCMTGTTIAGYGAIGTMSGFPTSQVISKQ